MKDNQTQDANYWIHNGIISPAEDRNKTRQKRFAKIFAEFMRCLNPTTIYSWTQAAEKQQTYQSFYYQLIRRISGPVMGIMVQGS